MNEDWKQEMNFFQGVDKARKAMELRDKADILEEEVKNS